MRLSIFDQELSLHKWVWLAYLRAALIPLLFVELALLAVYMMSHGWSRAENIRTVEALANQELVRLAINHAEAIEQQLLGVKQLTELLRQETEDALRLPADLKLEPADRYLMSKDGALYSKAKDGHAAVFFSGFYPINAYRREKVIKTARIDPILRSIVEINPLVLQAYFNSYDSLNRIWPFFDVTSQYPAKMDIPQYNFFYEADEAHNPERKTLWIDPYLDPAGQGWMVSSISPVYKGNFLEGVVGLDITLDVIIKQVLALPIPWHGFAILINKNGTLLALPERAEKLFGLHELTTHHYEEAIRQEIFKPDTFNIQHRSDLSALNQALKNAEQKTASINLDETYLLSGKTLPSTGWRLVIFAPESEIFKPAQDLASRLTQTGWFLLGGLCLFYVIFFAFLYRKALRLSLDISNPLQGIQDMAVQLGNSNFELQAPHYKVKEFNSTVQQMLLTADKLQTAEKQLVDAKHQAEQASYAKGAFLANMSHEIRTPLNAILGLSELAEDSNSINKLKHFLGQIRHASQSLLLLVNDILDFSKIEAGKIDLESRAFSLETLLQDLTNLFIRAIDNKQLELLIEVDPQLPDVLCGDVQRLRQILINLLGNAIKFTEYGEIHIKIDLHKQLGNEVLVRFAIRDTGIGISEGAMHNLFQAFTQADVSITRKFGGTGLGLAICQQLVALMKGNISVSSQLGHGSTFEFSVRLMAQFDEHAGILPVMPKDLHVLIIDNSSTNCHILQRYLRNDTVKISTAFSAAEALGQITRANVEHQCFSLLIIDESLLRTEKPDILTVLRLAYEYTHPELLLLTDSRFHDDFAKPLQGLKITPKAVLRKPVLKSHLLNTIYALDQNQEVTARSLQSFTQTTVKSEQVLNGREILLVEDVALNQQVAKGFLQKIGIKVTIANHGLEALELIKQRDFDAILMDVQMPVMDGLEATRQIRRLPKCKDLPIIAMTAAAMQHDQEACINVGMNDHLSKPLQSRQMIDTLLKWIPPLPTQCPAATNITSKDEPSVPQLEGFHFSELLVFLDNDYLQLNEVLKMFHEDFQDSLSEIGKLLDKQDLVAAEHQIHQLKGVAANIGAYRLHQSSEILDQQLKNGHYDCNDLQNWQKIFVETMETVRGYLISR